MTDPHNATERDYPVTDIVTMFRAAAEKYAGNTAVIFKDREYTYAEVDDISERIADYVAAQGIGHEDVVSILIPRSEYMVIASLGALKAGAAYQPLDPGYPSERLDFMMKDASAKLLIADEELLGKVPGYHGKVLLTKDIPALLASGMQKKNPAPKDLFILLYTSGSTGTPKGVMLEHKNLSNFCYWFHEYYSLDEHCRVSAYASFGFDANMMDMYPALTCGACVCIVEEEIRLDLMAMEEWFNRREITHAFMTTQVGRQFYELTDTPKLRFLSVGGEKLVPVEPREGGPRFINGYGPTECTIFSTAMPVEKLYDRVPIGKPLSNYRCYVVDENLNLLPPLTQGELLVAGAGVGRGYLNRPDLTEKAFIKNPFSDEPGYERAYHTGDIVQLLPDGNIDCIGRNDGQVKVRGFRIELTEVEAVIRKFPGIGDATVQAFEHEGSGEKYIAAYIVSDEEIDIEALKEFIGAEKPAYMIPASIMQIPSIPLNQNQKVDKRALPKPEANTSAREKTDRPAAPLNVLESELKDIISDVTGIDDFAITDSLRDLGLTSISGIRLAMQIYKKYGIQLNARDLVADGSLQSIENAILGSLLAGGANDGKTGHKADASDGDAADAANDAGRAAGSRACRLSFAQQGVYVDCQANPDTVFYNLPFVVSLPEGVSADALKAAVMKVVNAHPYILCRFVPGKDGEITQEPIPDCKIDIPVREMTEAEFEKYKVDFVRPFDLEKGPALRLEIVKTDRLNLLIDIHHLISDGASMDLFFEQLCRAIDGEEIEKEGYSYYDYVADEKLDPEAESFFMERMGMVEEASQLIPDIYEENLPHTEKCVTLATDFAAVRSFAGKMGVTPAAVYLAASLLAFSRYVCEDLVSIVTISNGRSNLKLSDTMGMFVNTLPIVANVDNSEDVASFIRRIAENFSDTISHENHPLSKIAAEYDFRPSLSYTYQLGVLNDYGTKFGSIAVKPLRSDIAKLPASVYIEGTEENARIEIMYDSSMYSGQMMQGLASSVENVVHAFMKEEKLSGISLTNEEDWKRLDGFNKTLDLDYDRSDSVVSKFRKNAAAMPDKPAAVFKDKVYSYRELDELTDRLAAVLYERVCTITGKDSLAEEVVAILIPRDENVFVLPLAAIKAGLAYEPLDPGYPKERLNFMVGDAKVCLLLADESLLDIMDGYDGAVMTVRELYEAEAEPVALKDPAPEDLFIMLYTSGSTGMPKGCQIEHRNLVAYAHGLRYIFCTGDDRTAAYASFGFDVNMEDVFCTLLNGGTVYLVPEEIRMNLDSLAAWFDENGITTLLLTTQVGVQFLLNYPQLKTLKLLVMGGEKLPAVDPDKLSYIIANGYGPTENCCGVSIFPIMKWEPNIPIGKPFSTINAFVLDKTGHRLPPGAAGEYCLSGPQVTRGYLNRPDKTAEAYEDCPFNDFRMYHTGDIVRYRQDGNVEFVGRKDGQVKIRGFRVELKEVEAVIRGYEGIGDVTVQAYDYEGGGKYLAAFVVSDAEVDTKALTEFIKSRKPAYMVPACIMQIDKVPLTINQKVDKKALPKPELKKAGYVAPEGKTEEDLCRIFAEVLGLERMGAEDDFFDMGGSSILALKVVIAAGKDGYELVYNDVFKHTTPRDMARFLSGEGSAAASFAAEEGSEGSVHRTGRDGTEGGVPYVDKDGYDYSRIHELLSKNTLEAFRAGKRNEIGDVLLLGGTGYLGSHVMHELIEGHDGKIFCFVRPGKTESGEDRLKGVLRGYFGDDYAALFGGRITVIEGDATDPAALERFKPVSADMTVINCAASVKHFAKGDEIERTNVDSVKNLTAWCEANNARLVHISTGSIMGIRKNNMPPKGYLFDEHVMYAGQDVEGNQYIHSKFMAERHIYEEILDHGLRAKVMRVGNLAPREDGQFQSNFSTNSFMNSIRGYQTMGVIGYDALDEQVEFSPIECVARAVLALAKTPDECVCFMPLNPHRPLFGDIIEELGKMGYKVAGAEDEEVAKALNAALADDGKREAVASLVAYNSSDDSREIGLESASIGYTVHILGRLGFTWPETGSEYMRRFLSRLDEKGFFAK